ncbi:MAG: hypothetical protein CME64_11215 [Halobacteriovoraceae bacterium]|nr:hypothetical protein [Halobacteriovoraceae bacterium]MBC76572.1 hypothetical protein [Halobacteriovoraceae bacterium]|tara:strand:- start:882 stop:1433 length:552 start_codon:yes stop_codon:yes gene_type:complete
MNSFEKMLGALKLLNQELVHKNTDVELTIVGSMAIYLNQEPISRFTEDVDFVGYTPDQRFTEAVRAVAHKLQLPEDWINDKADTIEPLPKNIENDVTTDERFSNIKLRIIKRKTIIKMKVYAYFMRQAQKDLDDLKLLAPTAEEFVKGVDYIKETIVFHHGKTQLTKQEDSIEKFTQFLLNSF